MAKELIPLHTNVLTVNFENLLSNGQEYQNQALHKRQSGDRFYADLCYWISLDDGSPTDHRTVLALLGDQTYNAR